MIGRFGVPVGIVGMNDASATVRPSMPWTDRTWWQSTSPGS